MEQKVIPVSLGFVKAFIIQGEKCILVDTGMPQNYEKFMKAFEQNGIKPKDISLIVITHNHTDHTGGLMKLQKATGAPVMVHRIEGEDLRNGRKTPVYPTTSLAKLMTKLMKGPKPVPFEPHIEMEDRMDLKDYGVKGKAVHTPGHTDGSISIILEDGTVIVGDTISGKKRGESSEAKLPFIAKDLEEIKKSLQRLIQEGGKSFYTSHGDVCDAEAVKKII